MRKDTKKMQKRKFSWNNQANDLISNDGGFKQVTIDTRNKTEDRQTEMSLGLSEISEGSINSESVYAPFENEVKITYSQIVDNYLSNFCTKDLMSKLLENLVLELDEVFDFLANPSLYIIDSDLIECLKDLNVLKKKHRFKMMIVQECEWIHINKNIHTATALPESSLYMDVQKLMTGKHFIHNKQQKYSLIPIHNTDNELLCMFQVSRNQEMAINQKLRNACSNSVLLKGELSLFQVFLATVGNHLSNMICLRKLELKNRDMFFTGEMIKKLICFGNEFSLIRQGQELVKEYMKFNQCHIFLLENSTDTLISISEEKIKQAKIAETWKTKEDPRMFKRSPKNLGVTGMVLRENKFYYSDYFTEAMLYEENSWNQKTIMSSNKPCAIIWVPITSRKIGKSVQDKKFNSEDVESRVGV